MFEYRLKVTGMMCEHCENHVNEAIKHNFKVKRINSDRKADETVFTTDERVDEEKLKDVIKEVGYSLEKVDCAEAEEKKSFFGRVFKK